VSPIRQVSDAVGRLGRSEVVIIAPSTDATGAERIVSRVRSLVEATPLRHGDRVSSLRVIAGFTAVGDFSTSSSDVVSLLLRAASELRLDEPAPGSRARLGISWRSA
jgi:GGDEF domain-containing protein